MKITVIGAGYVGLISGSCFAEYGHHVQICDIDPDRVRQLSDGICPIYEPGLEEMIRRNLAAGRLSFSTDPNYATDFVVLAVGTPANPDGSCDLSQIEAAARAIKSPRYPIVLTKSTVPPGTNTKIEIWTGLDHVISVPEFLREGTGVQDFLRPDRVIIGLEKSSRKHACPILTSLYKPFVRRQEQIIFMDRASAELTKYATNAMLATRISFMNDLARLAEKVGADIDDVREGLGSDSRIGDAFLYAGASFGGSCFKKDIQSLAHIGELLSIPQYVTKSVCETNEKHRLWLYEKIASTKPHHIAFWGLAFKGGTDDVRDSPAVALINQLHVGKWPKVTAYDPQAADVPGIQRYTAPLDAARGADALVLATDWPEFRRPDFAALKKVMGGVHVFDYRNFWDPEEVRAAGFVYQGVGRG